MVSKAHIYIHMHMRIQYYCGVQSLKISARGLGPFVRQAPRLRRTLRFECRCLCRRWRNDHVVVEWLHKMTKSVQRIDATLQVWNTHVTTFDLYAITVWLNEIASLLDRRTPLWNIAKDIGAYREQAQLPCKHKNTRISANERESERSKYTIVRSYEIGSVEVVITNIRR